MRIATYSILALALGTTACLRSTAFQCDTNADCGAGGTCAAVGFCSFPDPECASGERYADSAGTYANECVGGVTGDAGVDGSSIFDAPPGDGPILAGCPIGYNTISGGQGTHRYQLITTTSNWSTQRDACAATSSSAYLAIPDDANELSALATLGATTMFWVGISDTGTEGTFLTVTGAVPPFLPWGPDQPDNNAGGPGEDCVAATATQLSDERCQTNLRAICECEP
jgi:hypothetical protein